MECYANANAYINQGVKDKYLNFYHDVYDHSFSYRLLIRLRDFSQHGHLSVSCTRNNYYFDLIQIAEKPHFNHNKTLSQEIEKIIEEILSVYKDIPTFSLTNTIAEFIAKLFSIYNEFWNLVETELTKSCIDIQEVIKNNPCNIIDKQQLFSGLFIYEFIDGRLHVIPVNNGAQAMFERFKTEAESTYKKYKDAHSQLMEGSMLVRVVDGEQIQIKSGEDLT